VANDGGNDAMFCELCGAHRDRLGSAGKTLMRCPDCGRTTCANCWNQVAGGCLSCHAFTLLNVAPPLARPRVMPVRSAVPGAVETAATPDPTPTRRRAARFGQIRPGRVVRATILGSALAISVAAAGYAGVLRLAPSHVANMPATTSPGAAATPMSSSGITATPTGMPTTAPPEPRD